MSRYILLFAILCLVTFSCASCEEKTAVGAQELGRELVEQGRTLVHHAMKRFMIILPAIFFKLGIAFSLLLLVTIVAINNGFIGFMLLVVGLGSVLARLQEARTRPPAAFPVPIAYSSPHYSHHGWDRNDNDLPAKATKSQHEYVPQQPNYYNDLGLGYAGVTYNYGRR